MRPKDEFTCPKCGSHEWGTDLGPPEIGHCHGFGCHYTWPRTEDARVGILNLEAGRSGTGVFPRRFTR